MLMAAYQVSCNMKNYMNDDVHLTNDEDPTKQEYTTEDRKLHRAREFWLIYELDYLKPKDFWLTTGRRRVEENYDALHEAAWHQASCYLNGKDSHIVLEYLHQPNDADSILQLTMEETDLSLYSQMLTCADRFWLNHYCHDAEDYGVLPEDQLP